MSKKVRSFWPRLPRHSHLSYPEVQLPAECMTFLHHYLSWLPLNKSHHEGRTQYNIPDGSLFSINGLQLSRICTKTRTRLTSANLLRMSWRWVTPRRVETRMEKSITDTDKSLIKDTLKPGCPETRKTLLMHWFCLRKVLHSFNSSFHRRWEIFLSYIFLQRDRSLEDMGKVELEMCMISTDSLMIFTFYHRSANTATTLESE